MQNVINLLISIKLNLLHFFQIVCTWFNKLEINSKVLSDISAFEAIVISIAIPLSFVIVSRISERYKSGVISKRFMKEWEILVLPFLLIFNIILSIGISFFSKTISPNVFKLLALISFVGFISGVIILILFFFKVKKYMLDPNFILKRLLDDLNGILEL